MHNYLCGIGLALFLLFAFTNCEKQKPEDIDLAPISVEALEIAPDLTEDEYGFVAGRYDIDTKRIQRNESLYIILRRYDVSPLTIDRIQRASSDVANVNRIRPGQTYHIYKQDGEAVAMVWNISRVDYLTISWKDGEIDVTRDQFDMISVEKTVSGTIERSLYETLQKEGINQMLGAEIADIFAWQINFFSLRNGDQFTVVYDELYVGDEFYRIGDVHAAEFQHRGRTHRAYRFENDSRSGYFDEEGNSLHKALLKAPFRYSQRVSSGFSHNRFHPILKERRPHYGVDYAAPRGTPIIAAGDGVVTEARYRGGNGNIVQIRHNSVYKTAYLHLNGFASGIRQGVNVEQGQVIGYVGATGLATGPHLCYRLYVNDQPVNSRTVELPASERLEERYMDEFAQLVEEYQRRFEGGSEIFYAGGVSTVEVFGGKN